MRICDSVKNLAGYLAPLIDQRNSGLVKIKSSFVSHRTVCIEAAVANLVIP